MSLTLLATAMFASSCKKSESSKTLAAPDTSKISIFKYEGKKPVLEYLKELGATPFGADTDMLQAQVIRPGDEGLGWPAYPRTVLDTGHKVMKDYEVYVGTKAGFMDFFEVAAREAIKVTMSAQSDVLLAKNTPNQERLFMEGVDGSRFNLGDGLVYRAQCVYVSSAELSERFEYKLDAAGNGFTNGKTASQHLSISTYSGFFDIQEDWSLPDLREYCDTIYVERVRDSVAYDMVAAMNRSWETRRNDDATMKALEVVFYGGNLTRYGLHGHAFDVKKLDKRFVDSDRVELSGSFHHNIKGMCDNEKISYRCIWKDGQKERQKISFGKTSAFCTTKWKDAAKHFARDICKQGYLEFRRPSKPAKNGGNEYLTSGALDHIENSTNWHDF